MPFNLSPRGKSASGPRRTFRQPGMLIPGVVIGVACVGLIVLILVDSGLDQPAQLLWPLAGLLVMWTIFLRPCAEVTQAGVVLRNLVRDVHAGWPAIDLVEQRWNLKLYDAEGKGYGSWAITAQRPRRANRRSGLNARLGSADLDPDKPLESVMEARPGSAAGVAVAISAGQRDYDDAVKRDPSVRAADKIVVAPAWPAIGAIVVAIVCIVTAISV